MFSNEYYKIFKNTYFEEHLWAAASKHYPFSPFCILITFNKCMLSASSFYRQFSLTKRKKKAFVHKSIFHSAHITASTILSLTL